jgi:hypothetical protein
VDPKVRENLIIMESDLIRAFLISLGKRHPHSEKLYLLGGSALCLLGSPRPTLDIDYIGDDLKKDELQLAIEEIGREMGLAVEPVPITRFIPIPEGEGTRSLFIDRFGNIDVYIYDPYAIALSKIDRGFDTDLDDVVFLVKTGHVDVNELEKIIDNALPQAHEFDMNPQEVLAHFRELRNRLSPGNPNKSALA